MFCTCLQKELLNSLKPFYKKFSKKQKIIRDLIDGGFNLNIPDHDKGGKVYSFLNLLYENGVIPAITSLKEFPEKRLQQSITSLQIIL